MVISDLLDSNTDLILLSLAMLDIGQGDLEGVILPNLSFTK